VVHGLLPALTSFVGRAGEVEEIAGLLDRYRLVTVTGPGGVGKTRLAGEAARRVAARFADGVWLVELAAVQEPALVPAAVAAVLGLQQAPDLPIVESLAAALVGWQLLLVLDNCEHVAGAAAELCAALLPAADDVRVLATSREPVGLAGEARYRLVPLPVPEPAALGGVAGSAAVELFADRARQADPHFALDGDSGPVVARIVARLDGMPLAIELAAARVEALGLSALLDRLDDRFALLAGGDRMAAARQRSLAAAVDWSYQLLSEQERQVFRRIAVFPGPFTLQGGAAVAGAGAEPMVLHLVDCSLLAPPRTGPDDRARYLMLETLRAFGLERLTEAGQRPDAEASLARHALAVAEQAAESMQASRTELQAARWLDAESAAIGQAIGWALQHDRAAGLRMAVAVAPWWMLRGRFAEGYAWLCTAVGYGTRGDPAWLAGQILLGEMAQDMRAALGHFTVVRDAVGQRGASRVLADALGGRSSCLLNLGRIPEGEQDAHRALEMARGLGYPAGEMLALLNLGAAARYRGDAQESLQWHRQAGRIDPAGIPGRRARECSVTSVIALKAAGEADAARQSCAEGLAMAREAGDLASQVVCLNVAADLNLRAGHISQAGQQLGQAIELAVRSGYRFALIDSLDICGHLCAATSRWADALTVWAALTACLAHEGIIDLPHDIRRRQEAQAKAAETLEHERALAAGERGAAMTLKTAAEYAIVLTTTDSHAPQAPAQLAPLSAREQELLTLVARGNTDAQIAGQLYISVSTVRSHLDRIRDKTSCRRRADLTRLALRAGLV
jgi:predicted ATPase/DNA-binding CsgD family transcriptional regulator